MGAPVHLPNRVCMDVQASRLPTRHSILVHRLQWYQHPFLLHIGLSQPSYSSVVVLFNIDPSTSTPIHLATSFTAQYKYQQQPHASAGVYPATMVSALVSCIKSVWADGQTTGPVSSLPKLPQNMADNSSMSGVRVHQIAGAYCSMWLYVKYLGARRGV